LWYPHRQSCFAIGSNRNYEFQVPIFVLIHHSPSAAPKQDEQLAFTFVTDGVESAVAQAKAAARDKAVQVVGGVSIGRQLFDAGLVDELHVAIMPVFLGTGLRSFENACLCAGPARENQRAGSRRENQPQIPCATVVDLLGGQDRHATAVK
jgi:dihydrofolate reductase